MKCLNQNLNVMTTPRGCNNLITWLDWQETAHPKQWDLGLTRIKAVWQKMGAHRIAQHIVTVAGTNGKGSCVCWGEAICKAHAISVASFSSPHLMNYRERIRYQGEWVDELTLCRAFDAIDRARGDISLSYFEWSALAAFYLMVEWQPVVAILEVGLGGRLDATNIIDADAAVFTSISLDHQRWLGDTVEEIAREKSGVIRTGQRVVFAEPDPPQTLLDAAITSSAKIWRYGQTLRAISSEKELRMELPQGKFVTPLPAKLTGSHQYRHFSALAAILGEWFTLQSAALSVAAKQAHNPARLMVKETSPRYVFDVAHNPGSAEVLADFLRAIQRSGTQTWMVCGILQDKDRKAVIQILDRVVDGWFFCGLPAPRGSDAQALVECAVAVGVEAKKIHSCVDVQTGFDMARCHASEHDTIVVAGSFLTVATALTLWSDSE